MHPQSKSLRILIFVTAIACGASVQAVTPSATAGAVTTPGLQLSGGTGAAAVEMLQAGHSNIDLLREAYAHLAHADHDYKGRRGKAMREISAAAKDLGVKLKARHGKRVYQGVSDDRLRAAQGFLEQARDRFANGGNQRALKHVDSALEHITAALAIR